MSEEKKKEECVLHFTRVRGKGEPEFYEPNTDIRKVFPAAASIAIGYLKDVFKDNQAMLKQLDYLYRCFKVFQIRTAEDTTPFSQQLQLYVEAVRKADPNAVMLWRETQFRIMAALYGLFCRRDARTDGDTLKGMMETARLSLYEDVLDQETLAAMSAQLKTAGVTEADRASISTKGLIICRETEQVIDVAKTVAASFLNATGATDWDSLADACDREFGDGKDMSDEQLICVALAYPSYEHNDLGVEVTKDNG